MTGSSLCSAALLAKLGSETPRLMDGALATHPAGDGCAAERGWIYEGGCPLVLIVLMPWTILPFACKNGRLNFFFQLKKKLLKFFCFGSKWFAFAWDGYSWWFSFYKIRVSLPQLFRPGIEHSHHSWTVIKVFEMTSRVKCRQLLLIKQYQESLKGPWLGSQSVFFLFLGPFGSSFCVFVFSLNDDDDEDSDEFVSSHHQHPITLAYVVPIC